MAAKKRGKWETVGSVTVDSGRIWIGDPCYVLHTTPLPQALGTDWYAFAEGLPEDAAKAYAHDAGHEGLGVCIPSGLGDGRYPVQVHRDAKGDITMAIITFIPKEEED